MARYAAQKYEWDEKQGLNMKEYFRYYKDQFPILGVILGGWDGDTHYDCYDNLQVVRIHCYSSQPRVVIRDSNSPDFRFLTLPVDSQLKFQIVRAPNKYDSIKTMEYLLEHHKLPFLVRLACHADHQFKIGTSRCSASSFGNLLITEKYLEHYYMVNCIDGADPKMNPTVNLIYLTENLSMAPVTGLKNRPKAEFDMYMRKLEQEASGIVYDRKLGNPDFAEYDAREINTETGDGGIPTIDPPAIPAQVVEADDNYIEIPPELPSRPTPKMEPKVPKHKDPPVSALVDKKAAHAHKKKTTKTPLAVKPEVALTVEVNPDEKIPALPARRRLSQPTITPLGKQAAVPYVNTSVGRATVRPFRKKEPEPTGNDVTEEGGLYEAVGMEGDVYSEAYGDVDCVSKETTNKLGDETSENDTNNDSKHSDQEPKSNCMNRIKDLTINEIGDMLKLLKLDEYVEIFQENQVDGAILTSLERDDLVNELGMKKLPATRLFMYISEGHIPK